MLLQKDQIDGAATPVNSHGHHHHHRNGHNDNDNDSSSSSRHREDVVLCSVFHFAEPQRAIKRLQARFPRVRFIWHTLRDRMGVDHDGVISKADYRAATIYLTFNSSPPSLAHMPNLRFIQLLTSGHDHLRGTPLLSNPSIPVATCAGVSARPIAQYVAMQILSWAHQYPRVLSAMQKRRWLGPETIEVQDSGDDPEEEAGYPVSHVLAGKRIGIWGYGSIGRQVARILAAMGMHIIACTSSPKPTAAARRLHTQSFLSAHDSTAAAGMGDAEGQLPLEWHSGGTRQDLHKFLAADLDILAIFTPLTATTRQSLGKAEFDVLSRSSSSSSKTKGRTAPFLVNVSRGPIIVQDEMVAALKDGRLSAAALDVTDPEPLPAEHELWRLPNVSITPHMSWCFESYVEECVEHVLAENLARLDKGMKLVNQIQ